MFVTGKPLRWLRLEGLTVLATSLGIVHVTHQAWWWIPLILFTPDIFMVGYAKSSPVGAFFYNLGHAYPLPMLLSLFGWHWHHPLTLALGLIWFAHIGMDRLFGYGLKYDEGFKVTHLGRLPDGRHHE
jgi:hypothetical protein